MKVEKRKEVIKRFRDWLRKRRGKEIEKASEISYEKGWYWVMIARRFPDGSIGDPPSGIEGKYTHYREKDLLAMMIEADDS